MGTRRVQRRGDRRRSRKSSSGKMWMFLGIMFIASVVIIDIACRNDAPSQKAEDRSGVTASAPAEKKDEIPAAVPKERTKKTEPVLRKTESASETKSVIAEKTTKAATKAVPTVNSEWVAVEQSGKMEESYIWWEGEKPSETNVNEWAIKNAGKLPADQKEKLSGGNWIPMTGDLKSPAYYAKYNVEVPRTASYNFWVRKFWHHGPFKWRFDNKGEWKVCDKSIGLADSVELRLHTCANWKALGSVELSEGSHELHVEMLKNQGAGNIDCFLLIPGPFTPKGKNQPGGKYNRTNPGWFAFEPDADPFKESAMDMRFLNEKVAGSKGFLRAKGMDFEFTNEPGKRVKFWAANAGPGIIGLDKASLDYLARSLAKYGVNMVRYHGSIWNGDGADPTVLNRKLMDHLYYFQASLKKQGIYLYLSFYFPLWFNVKDSYGLPGFSSIDNKKPFALLYFHPRMQEIYKSWAKSLMTNVNPYTGKSFADDPAVGLVEINNEDNYLFWTFNPYKNIPAECMHVLEGKFYSWLMNKYGSIEKAQKAWGGNVEAKGDDFANKRAGVYGAGMFTNQDWAKRNRTPRTRDCLQFLTEDLKGFYESMMSYYKKDLGVKCPIISTNWTTADNRTLGALDKYTNTVCDVMDRHGYFTGKIISPRGYMLNKGDLFENKSALFNPAAHCVKEVQYTGHPHVMSEFNWKTPNRYRGESMLLSACYGSLQGTDGFYHFALSSAGWMVYQKGVCLVQEPSIMGQFPAASIIYRNGYVKEGPVVVHEALTLDSQYEFKGTATSGSLNLDRMTEADKKKLESGFGKLDKIDSYSYAVGQVTRTVSENPGKSFVKDLSEYIDRDKKIVKSATGELTWDYGTGLITVNTQTAQGATGFFEKAGTISCSDVTYDFAVHYGTAVAVSLDGRPLSSSGKILVQVSTESENYNWKTSDVTHEGRKMKRIDEIGAPPILVKEFAGTITLNRSDVSGLKITALDLNGYPVKTLKGFNGAFTLLPDVMYYIIEK